MKDFFSPSNTHRRQQPYKVIFFISISVLYLGVFVIPWNHLWQDRYRLFSVPANSWPGGDSRNIQMSAICEQQGAQLYEENECFNSAQQVRKHYPEAIIPPLNYPSHWIKIYSIFNDNDNPESGFRNFWTLNSIALLISFAALCFRYNPIAFPVALFNPITLLTIERGNTDAILFFLTFLPILIFSRSRLLQSFFLCMAASLKIFPIFGYLAFIYKWRLSSITGTLLGFTLSSPLLLLSIIEIPKIISETPRGFSVAYGLNSIFYSTELSKYQNIPTLIVATYLTILVTILMLLHFRRDYSRKVASQLNLKSQTDTTVFLVSGAIYLFSFLLFTNWAYRLIFAIPFFLIITNNKRKTALLGWICVLCMFYTPLLPYGWHLQNLVNYPISLLVAGLMFTVITGGINNQMQYPTGKVPL